MGHSPLRPPRLTSDRLQRLAERLEPLEPNAAGGRQAAVLVLLSETPGGAELILTRRREDLRSHPGQVAFAGGRREPGEQPVHTALREAREEIGLEPDSAVVLGGLPSFYLPPSRAHVTPVVAHWRRPHPLRAEPSEVAAILRVPLRQLLDPKRWRVTELERRSSWWAWQLDGDVLWGASAAIVADLLDRLCPGWNAGQDARSLPAEHHLRPWADTPLVTPPRRLPADLPAITTAALPTATRAQLARALSAADRPPSTAVRRHRAAVALATAVDALRRDDSRSVTVLAGASWPGSVALAGAAWLRSRGTEVELIVPPRSAGSARVAALIRDGVRVSTDPVGSAPAGQVLIDGLCGAASISSADRWTGEVLRWWRRSIAPIVALELPSGAAGLTSGGPDPVAADVTLGIGLPVSAQLDPLLASFVGESALIDLAIGPDAWRAAGVDGHVPSAPAASLLRLEPADRASDAATPWQVGGAG